MDDLGVGDLAGVGDFPGKADREIVAGLEQGRAQAGLNVGVTGDFGPYFPRGVGFMDFELGGVERMARATASGFGPGESGNES